MEANQITCPQCGLDNNELADSCVQCGIIFVKQPSIKPPVVTEEKKRKSIEAAEAMLAETQATSEIDPSGNKIDGQPDPHEDTIEMPIPIEAMTDTKTEATAPEEPKAEEDKNTGDHEIELEAIEAAMEPVEGTTDSEALFLSEITPARPDEKIAAESNPMSTAMPPVPEIGDGQKDELLESATDKKDSHDGQTETLPHNQPGDNPVTQHPEEEPAATKESGEVQSEATKPAETAPEADEVAEPARPESPETGEETAQPDKLEMPADEKPDLSPGETPPPAAEHIPENATIEMPLELTEEQSLTEDQAEKVKQDALKKQREAQVTAEAQQKERAAKVAALKKKKLALAKAEALKKQKAAQAKAEALKKKKAALARAQASKKQQAIQAKAEALKKQKTAQARAEASSREMQLAGSPMPQDAAAGMMPHKRLLGLLKRYKGKAIGINYDHSSEIREAELVDANEEFFSIRIKDKKLQYNYPLETILTIVEGREGVESGEGEKKTKYDAVIKVYPMVFS